MEEKIITHNFDSAEFLPQPKDDPLFVIGGYYLDTTKNSKHGSIQLFSSSSGVIEFQNSLQTSAILDLKWFPPY
jgi:hypothetical protein